MLKLILKLNYDQQLVGESVLVSGTHQGPTTNFSFSLKFSLDSWGFVILYRPLWRENGSVIYCYRSWSRSRSTTDSQLASQSWCQGPILDPWPILRSPWKFLQTVAFCNFVAPSLTRGRVCNLFVQLLLGLTRAVTLGSKSRRTHGHILLSHLRLPQPGGPDSRIYIPQEQGGLVILPATGSY
jgi:hypothetical protein